MRRRRPWRRRGHDSGQKTAAQADMTTAEGEVSSGKEEETSTDEESGSDFP